MIPPNHSVDISWRSIWRFYAILFLSLTLWYFRQVVFIVLVSFIVASLLERPINILERKWKNRWGATLTIYTGLGVAIILLAYLVAPVFTAYFHNLQQLLPPWLTKDFLHQIWTGENSSFFSSDNFWRLLGMSQNQIFRFFKQVTDFLAKLLGGAFSAFLILILSFFINAEKGAIEKILRLLSPARYEQYIIHLWQRTQEKVDDWFFSQLLLSLMVGVLAFVGFKLIGLPQALFLAILAALLDFIPYVGPVFAGLVAFLNGASQGLLTGVLAIVIFSFVQAWEAFIAPALRAKVMRLNPILVIVALLIGGKLAGVVGAIIALPLAAAFKEFLTDLYSAQFKVNS